MEQAGKQGSLDPVNSHFLGGGSEGVLQDTRNPPALFAWNHPFPLGRKGHVSPCVWAFVVAFPLYWRDQLYMFLRSWFGDLWLFPRQLISMPLQNSLSLCLRLRTEFGRESSPEFEAFLPTVWDLPQRSPSQENIFESTCRKENKPRWCHI